jgi:hypothetical protein
MKEGWNNEGRKEGGGEGGEGREGRKEREGMGKSRGMEGRKDGKKERHGTRKKEVRTEVRMGK